MDINLYTKAKAEGYKVVFDLVHHSYRALDPMGELVAERHEDEANSNIMWEIVISHIKKENAKNKNYRH